MAELYLIQNGPIATTAGFAKVTTGTAIKTMLQVKLGRAVLRGKIVEWGISFDGSALATPILCELLTTGTVAATVTAHAATGIVNLDPRGNSPVSPDPFTLSTTTTGYTATAEGTITTSRPLDTQLVLPTNQYIKQWPLGREPWFNQDAYLRIRVTAGAAVNAICYAVIEV